MKDQNIELPEPKYPGTKADIPNAIPDLYTADQVRQAIKLDRQQRSSNAKQRYDEIMRDDSEPDPIERLRFFCSLAMHGQDWLDVEPFFDALIDHRQQRGEPVAEVVLHNYDASIAMIKPLVDFEPADVGKKLYLAPQPADPCGASMSDKPACGAQNAKSEPQTAEPVKEETDDKRWARLEHDHLGCPVANTGIYAEPVKSTRPDGGIDADGFFAQIEVEPVKVPRDEDIEEFCATYADEMGCIHDDTHVELIRAALSRYSSGQPAVNPNNEPLVRFCPECGSLGDVPAPHLTCCPDGSHARMVPEKFAHLCHALFKDAIAQPAASAEPVASMLVDHVNALHPYRAIPMVNVKNLPDGVHMLYTAPVAAQTQQPVSSADALLCAICDAFHIGSAVRTHETVMANVENSIRRSRCLGVIEQYLTVETPPDPDEGDDEPGEECLLRWGAEPDTYAKHFAEALAQFQAAQPQPSGNSGELPSYTAADMASASAQGWRDGYDAARAQQEGQS